MNIFITGASGFVGLRVLEKLVADERIHKIFCLSRSPQKCNSQKVTWINEDLKNISTLRLNEKIDIAIHLAAFFRKENKKLILETNVEGTNNTIEFCEFNKIDRIIFTSSILVNLIHKGSYSLSKIESEQLIKNSGLKYIIFRPGLIYGENNPDGAIDQIAGMIKKWRIIPVIGNGNAIEHPIYVGEVADYIHLAVFSEFTNRIFEIGGLDYFTFNDLLMTISKKNHKKITLLHIPMQPLLFLLFLLERFKINFPLTREQVYHLCEDLKIDDEAVRKIYPVSLFPFSENVKNM